MDGRHPLGNQRKLRYAMPIDYVEAIINADVSRVDGIEKNPVRVRALLRSLSRNISTLATIRTIHDDIAMGDADESISEKTISQYLGGIGSNFLSQRICQHGIQPFVLRRQSAHRQSDNLLIRLLRRQSCD